MNVTLDTNCIIALEENRPEAQDLRRIVHSATEQKLRLRVVAISASERQPDGEYSESFRDFKAKIAVVGLEDVEILLPPCIWGVTYWDDCIWGSEQFTEEAERIHEILFPNSPFEYEDYCRHFGLDLAAPSADRKWQNHVIDTWALWTHLHNGVALLSHPTRTFTRRRRCSPGWVLERSCDRMRPRRAFCPI